jgi:hypothetical protein
MGGLLLKESAYGTPNAAVLAFSHQVIYAGIKQCAAGAATTITLPGLLATDIVLITHATPNTNSRYVITIAPAANACVVTFNGATDAADYIYYAVLRAC